ncbi:MAG: ABC transporter substrate-binding protein [Steroidobacteraceae bacterium]
MKSPARWFSLLSLAALVLATAAPIHADELATVKQKGTLLIGILGTDEPNSFVDPATRGYVGYEIDLGNALARRLGVKAEYKQLAVAARIPELQQGRVDILAASLTHNKEREALIDFSLTTLVTGQRIMVRKASGITALAQLANKKVVTVKGGTQETNARKRIPGVEVVTFETAQQSFQAFRQGKGLGYVNDEVSILADYAKLGADQANYLLLPENLSVEPLALGLRKGEPALKNAIDNALRDIEKTGEAEQIWRRWFGPDSRLKIPTRNFKFDTDKVAE